ncbi:MAG: ABC transporter permease subunit [Alphaproteobacteria bacterium]
MTTLDAEPGVALAEAPAGRSLWADAWGRLRANRAAMTSFVVLGLIALACIFGPMLSPHAYDQVYQEYVKIPPSLTPYPREQDLLEELDRTLRRTGVSVAESRIEDRTLVVELTSEAPIDPRISRYLERSDSFASAVIDIPAEGATTATATVQINRQLFLFGTESNGRDLMTRVFVGGRISLMIGLLATGVSLLIGVAYGAIAGYLGGAVDNAMMRLVDILYSLPFMFFVILLMVFFGRNVVLVFIAIGAIEWLDMARIVRGQTLSLKRQEYVQAAHAMGVGARGILRRHVIPNALGPVVIYMTLMVPKVILLESFLSFPGLGVQEPLTSWGTLIADGAKNLQQALWMLVFPAVFLVATLMCLNFIGDGLRDALDPKDR